MDEDGWTPLFDPDFNSPVINPNPGEPKNVLSADQATTDWLKLLRAFQLRSHLEKPGLVFHHDVQKHNINCTAMSGMTLGSADNEQWERITALAQVAGTLLQAGTVPGGYQPYDAPDNLPQTIFFKTGQHRLGILQITDLSDSKHWLKIRYKLAPEAPLSIPPVQLISFGPVIERVVADSKADFKTEAERTNAATMIDFDSGSLLAGPSAIWEEDAKAQKSWMQTNGVDALGVIPQVNGLVGLDMKVAAVPPSAWGQVLAPDFTNQLAGVTARETTVLSGQVGSVSTWFFQTRKGRMGILQITGFSDNPRGVKIRYKLVQNGAPQIALPTKTIVLMRATNQLVGATTDTRTVSVWSDSTVLPGEKFRQTTKLPDGETVGGDASLFLMYKSGKAATSTSFTWWFREGDGFGAVEAEAATAQILEHWTQTPLMFTSSVPREVFCVTNGHGAILAGSIEFVQTAPQPPDAAGQIKATVQVKHFGDFISFPGIGFRAEVPDGYELRATSNYGEGEIHSPAGPYDYDATWFPMNYGSRQPAATALSWNLKHTPPANAPSMADEPSEKIDIPAGPAPADCVHHEQSG